MHADDSPQQSDEAQAAELEAPGAEVSPEKARDLRLWFPLAITVVLTWPWLVVRLSGIELGPGAAAGLSGLAILCAAFVLTWGAEVAQLDISRGLAVAALALIAVLPEYAVDVYFAWTAGKNPAYAHYAVANMTGGNRLLIGVGWSLIVLLWFIRTRHKSMRVHPERRVEVGYLALATAYAFAIPFKGTLSLCDAVVLLALYGGYIARTSAGTHHEPELVGPSEAMGALPPMTRRACTVVMFLYSAAVILLATEPFAESLLTLGKTMGIDEFLLVQWVAPMASEAPELTVAAVFVMRLQSDMALGTLVSSKVNQWTLLVGALPIAYAISGGSLAGMPLDQRQAEELILTAAQAVFGFVVLAEMRLTLLEGGLLFVLFAGQLVSPSVSARYHFALAYLLFAALWLVMDGRHRQGCVLSIDYAIAFRRGGGRGK